MPTLFWNPERCFQKSSVYLINVRAYRWSRVPKVRTEDPAMFNCNTERTLSRLLAGLAITVTFVFAAIAHAVVTAHPYV